MIIAVDIDDVMIDFLPAWVNAINKDYNKNVSPSDITSWDIGKFYPDIPVKDLFRVINKQAFYVTWAKMKDGAIRGVLKLREMGHRVIFVTSAMNGHAGAKYRFLAQHEVLTWNADGHTHKDYLEVADKSLISADVIIDDRPENVVGFWEKNKIGILFDMPHNQTMTPIEGKVWRVKNWDEIIDLFSSGALETANLMTNNIKSDVFPVKIAEPVKHDSGKLRWGLLPFGALKEVVSIFTFGANKYGDYNWSKDSGLAWSRVFDALLRHITAWYEGENDDLETGKSHLAHAACCVLFLLQYTTSEKYKKNDDRPYRIYR